MINRIVIFRAIAILFVVTGHFLNLIGKHSDSFYGLFVSNFILGGTILFVFISGFLFHHVFYDKYEFSYFITGKIKKVFFPYIIC